MRPRRDGTRAKSRFAVTWLPQWTARRACRLGPPSCGNRFGSGRWQPVGWRLHRRAMHNVSRRDGDQNCLARHWSVNFRRCGGHFRCGFGCKERMRGCVVSSAPRLSGWDLTSRRQNTVWAALFALTRKPTHRHARASGHLRARVSVVTRVGPRLRGDDDKSICCHDELRRQIKPEAWPYNPHKHR